MTIGDRIREFGQQFSNYSQLAKLLDMTPGTLFRYSKDERKPGADILLRFYNLGCNINWLLSGEGTMLRDGVYTVTTQEEMIEEVNIINNNDIVVELRRQVSFLEEQIDKQRSEFLAEIRRLTPVIPRVNTVELKNSRRNTRYGL